MPGSVGSAAHSTLGPVPDRGAKRCVWGTLGSIQLPVINAALDSVGGQKGRNSIHAPRGSRPRKPQMLTLQGGVLTGILAQGRAGYVISAK